MEKDDLLTILVYVIMFVIALFIGLRVISPAFTQIDISTEAGKYTYAISSILAGAVLNIILFELGHVIGAKLGGYAILSVNLIGFCFYKSKDKWKFGFRGYDGLTGETRMIAKKEKANPKLHLWGPLLFYIFEFLVAIILYVTLPDESYYGHAALIVAGVGGMLIIYNIMPFKLDAMTDGYKLALITKPINIQAYNELIRIESLVYEGEEVKDIKVFDEITTLTATVNLYKIYELLAKRHFEQADKMLDLMVENKTKLNEQTSGRAVSQKLYIALVNKAPEAAEYYWFNVMSSKERKFVANDLSLESLRAYLLYSGIVTKSESECVFVLSRFEKALKREADKTRRLIEKELFEDALKRVKDTNPDWRFE